MESKMNFYTLICIVYLLITNTMSMSVDETVAMYKKLGAECQSESGASNADIENMAAKNIPITPEGNCLNACVMEKAGIIKDGKFSVDGFVEVTKMVTENNESLVQAAKEVSEECVKIMTATNKCDLAKQFMVCHADGSTKRGFNPKDMV